MFQYNRFWHFWLQLNNQQYSRVFLISLLISSLLIPAALFFPPLWGVIVALPLVVGGTIALFTLLSNFFYNRQNQQLMQLKTENHDENLNEEIDLYLNRRVVCPQELLARARLNLPHDTFQGKRAVATPPLIVETNAPLDIKTVVHGTFRRNSARTATNQSTQLYIKTVAATDGLSEVAAREMAEILGFGGLIPSNTITKGDVLDSHQDGTPRTNEGLVFSQQKIKDLIDTRAAESPAQNIKNSPRVQNAVAQFIFNLKTAVYRTKAQTGESFKLLHIQQQITNATDGLAVYSQLFNNPLPGQPSLQSSAARQNEQAQAIDKIRKINLPSFQQNFLLHLLLGSQDANCGNTLFTKGSNDQVFLHSIDHERIMPEDNYNITKKIPFINGTNPMIEKEIENVFPIRLWLAGLPQADAPFTREIMEQAIDSLNPHRLLAYHQHKKLFSSAAVGAQLDRLLLIKKVFEEEVQKPIITLTPKELFLKLINNHPTYILLKEQYQLSDIHTFALLGFVSKDAELSLLVNPSQYFPILGMLIEMYPNMLQGKAPFSDDSFKSSHAAHALFFNTVVSARLIDTTNKESVDSLTDMSKQLASRQ